MKKRAVSGRGKTETKNGQSACPLDTGCARRFEAVEMRVGTMEDAMTKHFDQNVTQHEELKKAMVESSSQLKKICIHLGVTLK